MSDSQPIGQGIIDTFRETYYRLQYAVEASLNNEFGDSVVLERLLDDLQNFSGILQVHGGILDPEEATIIATNVALLVQEVRQAHRQALDSSHYGTHHPVTYAYTGRAGRPRAIIDPDWLAWAHQHRSTAGIARFLNLGRNTVREALITNGLSARQEYPFEAHYTPVPVEEENGDIATDIIASLGGEQGDDQPQPSQPTLSLPQETAIEDDESLPELEAIGSRQVVFTQVRSYTSPVSQWTDEELDNAITRLRIHYPNAGLTFLRGSLLAMGQRVPRERIRLSLLRIDPVRRIFERRTIQRRTYSVPGPNSLWHHDGQHGLIRWRIVFHGFIDGYSRLITALRASNNNRASTVLDVFTEAITSYRVPSRVRGDHGTENIEVAAFMEEYRGIGRGSYIWGRSVHNVRIERLWVDLTVSLGAKWAEFFELLEVQSGLDINNVNHIWLLHYLFLADINEEVSFFVRSWNHHPIQMRGQLNRSPIDMYGFDMLIHGIRGDTYEAPGAEDLELYGVDWEALHEGEIAESQLQNNSMTEGTSSWVGQSGPPENLSEVVVDEPTCDLSAEDVHALYQFIHPLFDLSDHHSLERRWTQALAFCRSCSIRF